MLRVITTIITLLFCTLTFSQTDSTAQKEPRLNLLFLDHNNQPIEKSIILKSKDNEVTLEVKSDENGKIDVLIPTDNTYVIYLVNSESIPREEKEESDAKSEANETKKKNDFLSVLGSLLSLVSGNDKN